MGQAERRQLARILAELDGPPPDEPDLPDPFLSDPQLRRQRQLALIVLMGCCVALAGWIVVLAATLPHHFDAHHWRAVWVNFDVFLLAAFALTAWALWRQRQVVILLLMLAGTMLCCDAWFDVATSLKTSGFWLSLASAVFAELPLAFLAFAGARRLLKATVEVSLRAPAPAAYVPAGGRRTPAAAGRGPAAAGHGPAAAGHGPRPSLRHTPLSGLGLHEAFPRRRAQKPAEQAGRSA
jgi:hypothetical protein